MSDHSVPNNGALGDNPRSGANPQPSSISEPLDSRLENEFLKKDEVRALLRFKTVKTVERAMKHGAIPYIKLGSGRRATVLFRKADVIAHLKANFSVGGMV